jgi:multidrug efflux pump subunit AcrB
VIGRQLDQLTEANASALLASGLLSVLLFPALGLAVLKR